MFLQNKYTRIYFKLIDSAKSSDRAHKDGVYYEKHHIIPKSLGGGNDDANLVLLTAREHFVCHLLLCHMTTGRDTYKMASALMKMAFCATIHQERKFTSAQYELARRINHARKAGVKTGIPSWNKGLSIDDARVRAGIEKALATKASRVYVVSEETRAKIAQTSCLPRKPLSEDHKRNLSLQRSGVRRGPHSESTRMKQGGFEYHHPETKQTIRFKTLDAVPTGWVKGRPASFEWMWATDGVKNVKVRRTDLLPIGFKAGRTIQQNSSGVFI